MTKKEKMQKMITARNALSPAQHAKNMENFVFDLQLFGKGGGKKAGKILLTVGAFFLGAGHVGMHLLGATHSFASGIMAASLVGTIWNVASSRKAGLDSHSSPSIQRFDKAQEGMSSTSQIPVVYGMRKICGNQTFHETNAEQNTLHKHVVLCEGGIEGIVSVCANDLLIPTGQQAAGTVFTIQNVKYKDAKAWKDGKTLHLYANGEDYTIYLCNKGDAENADTYYEWQANTNSLVSYINRMHKGWQAFPYATTSKYPGDLRLDATPCYMITANVTADTVKGGTTYTFHDCEPPSNYEEVGGYPNMAWLDMSFQSTEELNGNPSVDCIVKGRKIYDPRTKKTAYSNNPALCVLDFLTNKRYGLGKWVSYDDVDIDSFIESASYCDQEVTVYDADDNPLKSKRYTLDMIIDERQDAAQWLQDMLSNFSAWLVISKDKIKLMVEQPSPIVHKFTDDNITSMTITPIKASEVPNHYEVSLCDPMYNNWRVIQVVHDDYADQKQRGKVISKTVELSGVTSQSQALRLAQFYSDYNLSCPIVVSFTTGIEAMALEPGDVISVSYRDTFVNMPVRISEIKETEENEFEITARQYNADIYGDDLSGGIQIKTYVTSNDNSDEDSPYFAFTNVKNLRAVSQHRRKEDGTVAYDIAVSFDLPQNYNIKSAKVYYKNNHVPARETVYFPEGVKADDLGYLSDWKCAGETSKTLKIPNVKIGDVYKIRAAVKSQKGREQDLADCPEVICKVTKRATVPPQPHNLTYDFSNDFVFSWNDVEDSDVMYYELRLDTQKGQTLGMLAKTSAPLATVKLSERKGKAYVYALNQQGKYSYPASCNWKYPKPNAPEYIDFAETPRGMNIKLPFFPAGVHKARLYISGTKSSDVIDTLNPVYEYKGDPGVYSIRACWVDLIGEGYSSFEYSFTIDPTFKPEWIADESLSIKKMDKAVADSLDKAKKSAMDILSINKSLTELVTEDGKIRGTITNLETKTASQIQQLSNDVNITVADGFKHLSASLDLQADRISSIITDLGKDPAESSYSAITQLVDGINARVVKGDVINQINMTEKGTTIDGKYLHITGTTKIDDNVIVGGMIKSGSITADKLSANTIALTGKQGIKGGATLLDANGMTVTTNSGSVSFDSQGMSFKDKNGQAFSVVGRFLTGIAQDGQYVKFTKPWDVIPNVMVIPTTMQTGVASYNASNTYTKCYAENVTKNGFTVRCYSCLGAGSGGMVGINKVEKLPNPYSHGDNRRISEYGWVYDHQEFDDNFGNIFVSRKTGMSFTLPIPKSATSATVRSKITAGSNIFQGFVPVGDKDRYVSYYYSIEVRIEYLANGKVIATDSTRAREEILLLRKLSFAENSTISMRVNYYYRHLDDGYSGTDSWDYDFRYFPSPMASVDVENATLNVDSDSVISRGTVAFLVTDTANKQYTIS